MAVLTPTSSIHLPNSNQFCTKTKVKTFLSINPSRQFLDYIPKLITKVQATISSRASVIDSSAAVTERDGGDGGFSSLNTARWMVEMEKPENAESLSRAEVVDFYVRILAKVLPSEREAQMCIYKASSEIQFFFCCEIEENFASELARISGVLSVSRDSEINEVKKDHESTKFFFQQSNTNTSASKFSPSVGKCVHWLVKMDKPGVEIVTKAQMVDYFANALTKVLGNEKDAQVCIYNISWEKDIGFCCQIDEENALKLSDVPGVLFVQPDLNPDSDNKNYKVDETNESLDVTPLPEIKTKRLFVTGLSFYTSEKTLRAAFEPFGELVEVKIIMDKISKRSKGYAFIEYTTEESAGAALKEMNGKIINGWMIVVDAAKTNPPKYNRGRPRQY